MQIHMLSAKLHQCWDQIMNLFCSSLLQSLTNKWLNSICKLSTTHAKFFFSLLRITSAYLGWIYFRLICLWPTSKGTSLHGVRWPSVKHWKLDLNHYCSHPWHWNSQETLTIVLAFSRCICFIAFCPVVGWWEN